MKSEIGLYEGAFTTLFKIKLKMNELVELSPVFTKFMRILGDKIEHVTPEHEAPVMSNTVGILKVIYPVGVSAGKLYPIYTDIN